MGIFDKKESEENVPQIVEEWHAGVRSQGLNDSSAAEPSSMHPTPSRAPWWPIIALVLMLAFAVVMAVHYKKQLDQEIADHQKTLVQFGDAFAALGRLDQAIGVYQQACELDPTDARAFFKYGLVLRAAGRERAAAEQFATAAQLDPSLKPPEARLNAARTPARTEQAVLGAPEQDAPAGTASGASPAKRTSGSRRADTRFDVQVGALEDRARAESLATELSNKYRLTTLVAPAQVGGKTLYRIRVSAESRARAQAVAELLHRERSLNAWIVPRP